MPNHHVFPRPPPAPPIVVFFIIYFFIVSSRCEDDPLYAKCNEVFNCGTIKNISYPFWGGPNRPQECGRDGFELLNCEEEDQPHIKIEDLDFHVSSINSQELVHTMTIARSDFWDGPCTSLLVNTTLDYNRFAYVQTVRNLTLYYGCVPQDTSVLNNFTCNNIPGNRSIAYYVDDSLSRFDNITNQACIAKIQVPIFWEGINELPKNETPVANVLRNGFQVEFAADWDQCRLCMSSNGTCGSNVTMDSFLCLCGDQPYSNGHCPVIPGHEKQDCSNCETSDGRCGFKDNEFVCFCSDGPHDKSCDDEKQAFRWKWKLVVGVISFGGTILFLVLFRIKHWISTKWLNNDEDAETFIQNIGPLAVKRYKYADLRKITNSFKEKLGQGGYGDVYRGKLLNGCHVAVKVLKASKENGQDFVNEVASIGRTSHVNVVTLLGYCFEGKKKALVYELMPNGSLEKFIYKNSIDPLRTIPLLGLERLFKIATGIARGLEYLHRGCNTRILHFDIKPHNILLDEDFCPKISDFGLSKLCTRNESIISMLDARGTIGYIAPEVFSRNFGRVSAKSDVYSYGMMILEMVAGRKNVDAQVSHISEIYFPDWIYEHLEYDNNFKLINVVTEEDRVIARKMILVGLWCIQTRPSDRPSMSEVIEMLEGSIEALQIPPKPFLSSPARSPPVSSTLSTLS